MVVAVIGSAIGGVGALYSAVDKVLLARIPYDHANDTYVVWRNYPWLGLDRGLLAGTDVVALAESPVIEDAIAVTRQAAALRLPNADAPVAIRVFRTTSNFFEFVGTAPVIGHGYTRAGTTPNHERELVITHRLWRDLGAHDTIVGSHVTLGGEPHTIVGVMPPEFEFTRHGPAAAPEAGDAFVQFTTDLAATSPRDGSYAVMVRARSGIAARELDAAVAAIGATIDREHLGSAGLELYALPAREDLVATLRPTIVLVAVAAGFFLLVVVLAVAGALLSGRRNAPERVATRGVRADAARVAMFAVAGGMAAMGAALCGSAALEVFLPADFPRGSGLTIDFRIAVSVFGAAALCAGTVARLGSSGRGVRASRAETVHGRHRRTVRDALDGGMVIVQVAATFVLLATGGVLLRNLQELSRSRPGFDARGVLALDLSVVAADAEGELQEREAHAQIRESLRGLPGVVAVGAANALPLAGAPSSVTVSLPEGRGHGAEPAPTGPLVDNIAVVPGYFEAMGIELLEGVASSSAGNARDVVVDRLMAERFFPSNRAAIGATLIRGQDSVRIVGVVEHSRMSDLHADGRPQLYVHDDRAELSSLIYVIRTAGRGPTTGDIRRALGGIDGVSVSSVRDLHALVGGSLHAQRALAAIVTAFAAAASLLVALALFRAVLRQVARRESELCIRLARGGRRIGLALSVVADGMLLTLTGIAAGLAGVPLLSPTLRGLFFAVPAYDMESLVAVVSVLVAITLAACYLPAQQVLRMRPPQSLGDV